MMMVIMKKKWKFLQKWTGLSTFVLSSYSWFSTKFYMYFFILSFESLLYFNELLHAR